MGATTRMKISSEAEFGVQVLSWLRARGWHCWSEVELDYGTTSDIVAIRNRRVILIELKLAQCEKLYSQLRTRRIVCGRQDGLRVIGLVSKRVRSTVHTYDSLQVAALEDGQCYWRGYDHNDIEPERCGRWQFRWDQVPDLPETPHPADRRWLCMFEGLPETNGAGTPTGSKTVALYTLTERWMRAHWERIQHLKLDEMCSLVRMWLPGACDSYVRDARNELRSVPRGLFTAVGNGKG